MLLRTGELLNLRKGDFALDARFTKALVNFHQTEVAKRWGREEHSPPIDDTELVRLARTCLKLLLPGDPLASVYKWKFFEVKGGIPQHRKLAGYGIQPYSHRRGGATHHYRMTGGMNPMALEGRLQCFPQIAHLHPDALAKLQGG